MSSTATNKQPLLVDRPLYGHALVTNQTVGSTNTVNVQGGQAPQLLVDMDAALAIDTNNGGLVEVFGFVVTKTSALLLTRLTKPLQVSASP